MQVSSSVKMQRSSLAILELGALSAQMIGVDLAKMDFSPAEKLRGEAKGRLYCNADI